MCGRYALTSPPEVVAAVFGLAEVPRLEPRRNVAPTEDAPVIRADASGVRRLDELRWGLVPFWAEGPPEGRPVINARCESAAEAPMFRAAYRHRRCLVPITGFYEWQPTGGRRKQAYLIRRKDGTPFALAGLWERWRPKGGEPVESFTILTRDANDLVRPIHDRMPVIVAPEQYGLWLDPAVEDPERISTAIPPAPESAMEAIPVPSPDRPAEDRGLFG
jgi:putative SOS response-associated peptidase YedK